MLGSTRLLGDGVDKSFIIENPSDIQRFLEERFSVYAETLTEEFITSYESSDTRNDYWITIGVMPYRIDSQHRNNANTSGD